jgi:flagellar hook-basal body complex protein FliE
MAPIVPIGGGSGIDALAFYRSMPQLQGVDAAGGANAAGGVQGASSSGFKDLIADKLKGAIELQGQGEQAALSLATGQATDISQATVAVQKAAIALQTVAAFRNKALEAYQDVMRMQV